MIGLTSILAVAVLTRLLRARVDHRLASIEEREATLRASRRHREISHEFLCTIGVDGCVRI